MPITLANVVQVDELFKQIVEGKPQLDTAIALEFQKLSKGACKAIANALLQRITNADLIIAELTEKKWLNGQKDKNCAYGCVLSEEVIQVEI